VSKLSAEIIYCKSSALDNNYYEILLIDFVTMRVLIDSGKISTDNKKIILSIEESSITDLQTVARLKKETSNLLVIN